MYLLFVILMVIAALLMCFIVLIQNSKGGGLASGFSSSNAIMGVRKTTDFLEKATWGLAIFMVVMSIATAYVVPRSAVAKDAVLEQAQKEQQTNPYNLPAGTAAPQTEAGNLSLAGRERQPVHEHRLPYRRVLQRSNGHPDLLAQRGLCAREPETGSSDRRAINNEIH